MKSLAALMIGCGILAATPTYAQLPAATAERVAAATYAKCLLRQDSRAVRFALETGFDAPFDAAVAKLATPKCAAGDFSAATLRGPLFAAVYRKFGPGAGRSAANIISNWVPNLPASDERLVWYQVGACVLAKSPDKTRDLVLTLPGSAEENAEISAIVPALAQCLPAGQRFSVDRGKLVGALAEIVYRVDIAPRGIDRGTWGD